VIPNPQVPESLTELLRASQRAERKYREALNQFQKELTQRYIGKGLDKVYWDHPDAEIVRIHVTPHQPLTRVLDGVIVTFETDIEGTVTWNFEAVYKASKGKVGNSISFEKAILKD
jgi:hypothetical protein